MGRRFLKGLMVILDGLGDVAIPELGGCTPLEAAHTPCLDRLAQTGAGGLVDPLTPGVAVDTHNGVAMLIGVPAAEFDLLKRGPIEAAGAGLTLRENDVAVRCNFATVAKITEGRYRILDRRAGRLGGEMVSRFCETLRNVDLGNGLTGSVFPATQHRVVLQLTGDNLSDDVTDSDPGAGGPMIVKRVRARRPGDAGAERVAEAINTLTDIAYARLKDHPLNSRRVDNGQPPATGIICRGAGKIARISSLLNGFGLKGCLISGDCTVLGLAAYLGYDYFTADTFTALPDTDIKGKLSTALESLNRYDIAFVHLKAPDICSHDLMPLQKKAFLERFDAILGVTDLSTMVAAVSGDHSTSSISGTHCSEPVPSLIASKHIQGHGCRHFNEKECGSGSLGRLTANTYLLRMLVCMGYGGVDTRTLIPSRPQPRPLISAKKAPKSAL